MLSDGKNKIGFEGAKQMLKIEEVGMTKVLAVVGKMNYSKQSVFQAQEAVKSWKQFVGQLTINFLRLSSSCTHFMKIWEEGVSNRIINWCWEILLPENVPI